MHRYHPRSHVKIRLQLSSLHAIKRYSRWPWGRNLKIFTWCLILSSTLLRLMTPALALSPELNSFIRWRPSNKPIRLSIFASLAYGLRYRYHWLRPNIIYFICIITSPSSSAFSAHSQVEPITAEDYGLSASTTSAFVSRYFLVLISHTDRRSISHLMLSMTPFPGQRRRN
jgi:hypothetical protein